MENRLRAVAAIVLSIYCPVLAWAQDSAQSVLRGKEIYSTHCLACHQADGSGVPRLNPPLANTDWVTGSKSRLIDILLKGLDEEIQVSGEFYQNVMPAQPQLSDREIADVLTYIRNAFGNRASAVRPEEVRRRRMQPNKKE